MSAHHPTVTEGEAPVLYPNLKNQLSPRQD